MTRSESDTDKADSGEKGEAGEATNASTNAMVSGSAFDSSLAGEQEESQDWLMSFLDIMILVLTFFVAFIVTHIQDKPPEIAGHPIKQESAKPPVFEHPRQSQPIKPIDEFQNQINQQGLESGIDVDESDKVVTLSIAGRLLFDSGSAQLSQKGRQRLIELAPILKSAPGEIEVVGHTDNRPISADVYPTNWELSSARASRVVRLLINEGVAPAGIKAVGRADTQPVASNDTEADRRKNRRVEIRILKVHGQEGSGPDTNAS